MYLIKNNLPFFYIKGDQELIENVVDLFSSLYNWLLYEMNVKTGDIAHHDNHISCETNRCDVSYEMLNFEKHDIALIYLPFECYRFRKDNSRKLFIDLVNQKIEISTDEHPFYGKRYEELKNLLNQLLIDPDWYSAFFEGMITEENGHEVKFYHLRLDCFNQFLIWFNNNVKEIPEDLWEHVIQELKEKTHGGFYGIVFYEENDYITVVSPVYLDYFGETFKQYWENEEYYAHTGKLLRFIKKDEI